MEKERYNGVLIVAEQYKGNIQKETFELLSRGNYLSGKIGVDLSVIVFGSKINNIEELYAYSADKIYHFSEQEFDNRHEDQYIEAIVRFISDKKPEIVLYGSTFFSKSISAGVAAKLQTGLTADCTSLDIDPNERLLWQTRPAFGGTLYATIICPDKRPQMATVRPNTFEIDEPDYTKKGKIITIKNDYKISTNIKTIICSDHIITAKRLEEYDILIGIGRGVNYDRCHGMVEEFADLLGAGICGSRAVIDAGTLDYRYQVGLSGKCVKPKLYFALGISGAVQHLAGIQSAETIVAINNDPCAPIFNVANIGVTANVEQILPKIIEELKV